MSSDAIPISVTQSATITFTAGESPDASKLNSLTSVVTTGVSELCGIIGDPYKSSDSGLGGKYQNWVNNLSRDIGNRDSLNPTFYPNVGIEDYEQSITVGAVEHELDLIPVSAVGATVEISCTDTTFLNKYYTSVAELTEVGDWTIAPGLVEDGIQKWSRKLVTYAPAPTNTTITIGSVTTGHGDTYSGASFNVNPCVAQAVSASPGFCAKTSTTNGYYRFTLPFNTTGLDRLGNTITPSLSNTEAVPDGRTGTRLKWPAHFLAPAAQGGLAVTTLGKGTALPTGILQVYKYANGAATIVTNLSAIRTPFDPQSNATYEIDILFGGEGQKPGSCPFVVGDSHMIVTDGVSVSELLGKLKKEFYHHSHAEDDLVRQISHSKLMGLRTTDTNPAHVSDWYGTSNINANDHPQYLHRNGLDTSDTGGGYNIMRGDLLVGSTSSTGDVPNYNLAADSHKIYFGADSTDATCPSIYYDNTIKQLSVKFHAPYDAIVGTESYCTHSGLTSALADSAVPNGSRIFVVTSQSLTAQVNITKNGILIEGKSPEILISGTGGAAIGFNITGARVEIKNLNFRNFSTTGDIAIKGSSTATGLRIHDCFFDTGNNIDFDVNTTTNFLVYNNISY